MPPLPPLPNAVKMQLVFDNTPTAPPFPSRAFNILHLQYPTMTFTAVELQAVAQGALHWWGVHFAPSVSTSWQLTYVKCTAIDGSGVEGTSTGVPTLGTAISPPLPPQCAVCVSWLGAPSYRGGKPRTYLPGIPQSAIVANTSSLQAGYAGTLKAAAIAAINDNGFTTIAAVTAQLGAVSYIKKSVNPTPPYHRPVPLFWPYLGANVHERLDSQRRRSGKESTFPIA